MRWPIRSQILLPLLLSLAGVAASSAGSAWASARQARAQVEGRLRSVAQFLSQESRFPLTADVLGQMRQLSGADFLLVTGAGKHLSSLPGNPTPPAGVPAHDEWQSVHLGPAVAVAGRRYLASGIRLHAGPNAGDELFILYPEGLWRDVWWESVRPALLLGAGVGAVSLGLALAFAARLARRIRALRERTRLIAAGDFTQLPVPARDDELRDLTEAVNEMTGQLARFQKGAQQTERLRLLGQVSGGLAHQMRNGLTGARLAVQLFAHEASGKVDTAPLRVALRQLTLLEAHLERFLNLGRSGCLRPEACPLAALVGEAVELMRPRCQHAGIAMEWAPPADRCVLRGDPGQLGQVVLNLLGNAIEAAGPGGRVEVRLVRAGEWVRLEVLDNGPGPPAGLAGQLFEPFVTGKPEGIGLGLAVARQVVEAHGGRIGWSREGGDTSFLVELPVGDELAVGPEVG